MLRNPRMAVIVDIAFVFAMFINIIALFLATFPIQRLDYIPIAMDGLTTAASILVGVFGALLTRYISGKITFERRARASFYILILAAALFFDVIAYVSLLGGESILAFKITLAVFSVCYLAALSMALHILYET